MHSSKKKQKRTLRPRGLKGSQKIYSGSEILKKKKSKKKKEFIASQNCHEPSQNQSN
jgi:hypothetical protein